MAASSSAGNLQCDPPWMTTTKSILMDGWNEGETKVFADALLKQARSIPGLKSDPDVVLTSLQAVGVILGQVFNNLYSEERLHSKLEQLRMRHEAFTAFCKLAGVKYKVKSMSIRVGKKYPYKNREKEEPYLFYHFRCVSCYVEIDLEELFDAYGVAALPFAPLGGPLSPFFIEDTPPRKTKLTARMRRMPKPPLFEDAEVVHVDDPEGISGVANTVALVGECYGKTTPGGVICLGGVGAGTSSASAGLDKSKMQYDSKNSLPSPIIHHIYGIRCCELMRDDFTSDETNTFVRELLMAGSTLQLQNRRDLVMGHLERISAKMSQFPPRAVTLVMAMRKYEQFRMRHFAFKDYCSMPGVFYNPLSGSVYITDEYRDHIRAKGEPFMHHYFTTCGCKLESEIAILFDVHKLARLPYDEAWYISEERGEEVHYDPFHLIVPPDPYGMFGAGLWDID